MFGCNRKHAHVRIMEEEDTAFTPSCVLVQINGAYLDVVKKFLILNSNQRIQNWFSDMGDVPDEVFFFLSTYDPYHLWQHCSGRSIISLHRLVKVNKKPYDTCLGTNTFNKVFPVSLNVVSLICFNF